MLDLGCFHADHAAHFASRWFTSPWKFASWGWPGFGACDARFTGNLCPDGCFSTLGCPNILVPRGTPKKTKHRWKNDQLWIILGLLFLETSRYTKTLSWGCNEIAQTVPGCRLPGTCWDADWPMTRRPSPSGWFWSTVTRWRIPVRIQGL